MSSDMVQFFLQYWLVIKFFSGGIFAVFIFSFVVMVHGGQIND